MSTLGQQFLEELEMEKTATRKCLERYQENLAEYKPHEKSMKMGYLALLVAEIPRWISTAIEKSEINFASFEHPQIKTTEELVNYFDKNMESARQALQNVSDQGLEEFFYLKSKDTVLMKDTKKNTITSSINHMVHHRGQLTVYMRLNDLPVPSIYGPSADDKSF